MASEIPVKTCSKLVHLCLGEAYTFLRQPFGLDRAASDSLNAVDICPEQLLDTAFSSTGPLRGFRCFAHRIALLFDSIPDIEDPREGFFCGCRLEQFEEERQRCRAQVEAENAKVFCRVFAVI